MRLAADFPLERDSSALIEQLAPRGVARERSAKSGNPVQPLFSVVVPMKDESENVVSLVGEITACCRPRGPFEILLVDDGSSDDTSDVIRSLQVDCPELNLLRHETCAGQSAAVHNGVLHARAPIICTLDGDGQNPPDQIPNLLDPLMQAGADASLALVAGIHCRNATRRVLPTDCVRGSSGTALVTPAAGSKHSDATRFWRCHISTICTAFFRPFSCATGGPWSMSTSTTGHAWPDSPSTTI